MEERVKLKSATHSNKPTGLKASARYQAMETLDLVYKGEAFVNQEVNQVLSHSRVGDSDRDLYTRLVYGSLQFHWTLQELLKQVLKRYKRTKKWLLALLELSAYQHYYLDAIPDHAIVDEAVRIAKKRGNQTMGRFTNGTLRNLFRTYPTIEDFISQQASDQSYVLSLETSLPLDWVKYFDQRFGFEITKQIAQAMVEPAQVNVRISRDYWQDQDKISQSLADQGFPNQSSQIAPHQLKVKTGNPAQSELFEKGVITIQDEAASLAVDILNPKAGDRVLDACAAPGGKTVQLAEYVGKTGQVLAFDIAENKLPLIADNVKRMHVDSQVSIQQGDASQLGEKFPTESFDGILVDAPCSGVGLFRRKPDTKLNKDFQDLKNLQKIQLEILNNVSPLLKKAGRLVYSTCTITAEENWQVVEEFLATHPDFALKAIGPEWQEVLQPSLINAACLEILPHHFNSDGFFVALLEKQS